MTQKVLYGIDRVGAYGALLGGQRLGLITGASGVGSGLRSSIDLLREAYQLTALFAPEHGIRGELQPGAKVRTQVDPWSGITVYSLFADEMNASLGFDKEAAYMPSREAMDRIDRMVFDIQDVGSRYYTYPSTLYYAMKACARVGKPLTVLDRPNPIGGVLVEGNCHREENLSFIGLTRIPIRHGWTLGELAQYFNGEHGLGCDLTVIPAEGWSRAMRFEDTGLALIAPSPNLPTLDAITLYNGTCMLAGTNASDGRGTTQPFELIGAPYIDPLTLADAMNAHALPGVLFRPAWFLPQFSKHAGTMCSGVQLHVTDRRAVRPVALGVYLIRTLQALYPQDFQCTPPKADGRYHIDLSTGTSELREGRIPAGELVARWEAEAAAFLPVHTRYQIYA